MMRCKNSGSPSNLKISWQDFTTRKVPTSTTKDDLQTAIDGLLEASVRPPVQ